MSWDFAEVNPFSNSGGNFLKNLEYVFKGISVFPDSGSGFANQKDASTMRHSNIPMIVSTDPPYYDNVPYADISDYFYVWLRRSMKTIFPDLFSTIAVPKNEEIVAFTYRHKDKEEAAKFFMIGISNAMNNICRITHISFPITIYYAFKQSESLNNEGTSSRGWVKFLEAIISENLQITGTWPIRTERQGRMRGNNSNALASSIVLVCRKKMMMKQLPASNSSANSNKPSPKPSKT
jgi:putative DNA methylase